MNRSVLSVLAAGALVVTCGLVPTPAVATPVHPHDTAETLQAVAKADPGTRATGRVGVSRGTVRSGGIDVRVGGEVSGGDVTSVGNDAVLRGHGVDVVSRQVSGGFQLLAVIADETGAVQTYRFPGRFLELTDDGVVIVRASGRTGEPLAVLDPAWAKDADGARVPSRYAVNGDILIQTTDLDATTAFPVVADPRIRVAWYGASVDFSRAETKAISQAGNSCAVILGFAGVIAGQAGLTAAVVVGALTAGCGAAAVLADVATSSGKCVSLKIFAAVPGATAPWISTCYK